MKKNGLVIGLVILMLVLGGLIYTTFAPKAEAAAPGDLDGVNLHIKTEGSLDHGATWFNFSGTEESDNASLNAVPGETIDYRIKVWNDGLLRDALNVQIEGTVTNPTYVTGLVADGDADGDLNGFVGFTFAGGGVGQIANIDIGGTELAGYQMIDGQIQLSNNIPAGTTIMLGTVRIVDYAPEGIGFNSLSRIANIFGVNRARADGAGRQSAIRITIGVGSSSGTGTKLAATPTESPTASITQTTALPQTGGSIIDDVKALLRN